MAIEPYTGIVVDSEIACQLVGEDGLIRNYKMTKSLKSNLRNFKQFDYIYEIEKAISEKFDS